MAILQYITTMKRRDDVTGESFLDEHDTLIALKRGDEVRAWVCDLAPETLSAVVALLERLDGARDAGTLKWDRRAVTEALVEAASILESGPEVRDDERSSVPVDRRDSPVIKRKSKPPTKDRAAERIDCSVCGGTIRRDQRFSHLKDVHGLTGEAANRVGFNNDSGIKCPVEELCQVRLTAVNNRNVMTHMRNRHPHSSFTLTGDNTSTQEG